MVAQAGTVRSHIGVASQQATVDGLMSAKANLEMIARLHHVPKAAARAKAGELLQQLDLDDAGNRLVKTFSGGMRRRLARGRPNRPGCRYRRHHTRTAGGLRTTTTAIATPTMSPTTGRSSPMEHPVAAAWMYCAALLVIAVPLSLRRYRTRTTD